MLLPLGILAVIYVLIRGRRFVSRETACVVFLFTAYFTYSFLWSIITILYVHSNLYGSTSNFTYSVIDITNAYQIALSGLAIALAVCTLLTEIRGMRPLMANFNAVRMETAFGLALFITFYACFSLARNLGVAGSFTEMVRNRNTSDPFGTTPQVMFGIPVAIALLTGDRRQLRIAWVFVGATLAAGLFSGRTSFIAVGMAPVLVIFIAMNSKSFNWRGVAKTFGVIVLGLGLLQGYRTMRNVGEGGHETKALQLSNSFVEILALSRVVEKTSRSNDYVGATPLIVPFYMLLPSSVAGAEKMWYFTHWKTDHYVGHTFFYSTAAIPITIFGDGFLMYGEAGVVAISVFVGLIMYFGAVTIRLGRGGVIVGLVIISALFECARNGIAELVYTVVVGVVLVTLAHIVDVVFVSGTATEKAFANEPRIDPRRTINELPQ